MEEGIKFGGTCRNGRSIPEKVCKTISHFAAVTGRCKVQQVQQLNMVIDKWNQV
jgi:hypothetical protein